MTTTSAIYTYGRLVEDLDKGTGLHYNYFRDYDPAIGRYVESDPIGLAGGVNTYGYVGGNPLRFIDPTGETPILAALAAVSVGYVAVTFGYGISVAALCGYVCDAASNREAAAKAALDACLSRRNRQPGIDCSREIDEYDRARRDKIASCLGFATAAGQSMAQALRIVTRWLPTP